jgi:hypothetical protein
VVQTSSETTCEVLVRSAVEDVKRHKRLSLGTQCQSPTSQAQALQCCFFAIASHSLLVTCASWCWSTGVRWQCAYDTVLPTRIRAAGTARCLHTSSALLLKRHHHNSYLHSSLYAEVMTVLPTRIRAAGTARCLHTSSALLLKRHHHNSYLHSSLYAEVMVRL